MSEMAFVRIEACGCTTAVTVEDPDFHYTRDVANWKRWPGSTRIERVTVERAREMLGEAISRMRSLGLRKGHPKHSCGWSEPVAGEAKA